MKEKEITEGNAIIAKFMGMEINPHSTYSVSFTPTLDTPHLYYDFMEGEEWYFYLEFDDNWNWLMPVVQRIESTTDKYYVKIAGTFCEIYMNGMTGNKINHVYSHGETKIEAVFSAVVQHIQKYILNENK